MSTPTLESLKRAVSISEQIAALQAEMTSIFEGAPAPATVTSSKAPAQAPKKKGEMSAAGRAAIVAAQKARWAKKKGEAERPEAAKAPVSKIPAKKSAMSEEHRAKLAAAAKARWSRIKNGKEPSPFKK